MRACDAEPLLNVNDCFSHSEVLRRVAMVSDSVWVSGDGCWVLMSTFI